MMRRLGLVAAMLLLASACSQQQPDPSATSAGDAKANANPEKYARDRDECRAVADDYMKTRRNVDDSRRDVFAGNYERYGQSTLPTDMDNYGDSKRTDRLVASCMERRGYTQPQKSWWQR